MVDLNVKIRWGAERRLEYIEFRIFWDGAVSRSDLTERFGVSVPQASIDLRTYQQFAPGNLLYDSRLKRYVASDSFAPIFLKPNADRYLSQLQVISDGIVDEASTWMNEVPNCDALSIPLKRVEPQVLKSLIAAVRKKRSIEIRYQSMSGGSPEQLWRRITPHSFAFDGLRWHVRSFCHRDRRFKDFVLSRCYETRDPDVPGASIEEDYDWNTRFDVVLGPNPRLSPAQQSTIALDYGMANGEVHLSVRKALLFYFDKRLRFDFQRHDAEHAQNPVVVLNRSEYELALGLENAAA